MGSVYDTSIALCHHERCNIPYLKPWRFGILPTDKPSWAPRRKSALKPNIRYPNLADPRPKFCFGCLRQLRCVLFYGVGVIQATESLHEDIWAGLKKLSLYWLEMNSIGLYWTSKWAQPQSPWYFSSRVDHISELLLVSWYRLSRWAFNRSLSAVMMDTSLMSSWEVYPRMIRPSVTYHAVLLPRWEIRFIESEPSRAITFHKSWAFSCDNGIHRWICEEPKYNSIINMTEPRA